MTVQAAKQALRESMAGLTPPLPAVRRAVVDQVGGWLEEHSPGLVVGFLGMGAEIDMSPLVERLPDIRFALTRTAPGVTLTIHPFEAVRERHPYGFEQPAEGAPTIARDEVDVVLVPGLAFDRAGRRLGRGAGYYDRFLAGLEAETVAMTTEAQIVDEIPAEPHDVPVRWIATETGVVRSQLGPSAHPSADHPS